MSINPENWVGSPCGYPKSGATRAPAAPSCSHAGRMRVRVCMCIYFYILCRRKYWNSGKPDITYLVVSGPPRRPPPVRPPTRPRPFAFEFIIIAFSPYGNEK